MFRSTTPSSGQKLPTSVGPASVPGAAPSWRISTAIFRQSGTSSSGSGRSFLPASGRHFLVFLPPSHLPRCPQLAFHFSHRSSPLGSPDPPGYNMAHLWGSFDHGHSPTSCLSAQLFLFNIQKTLVIDVAPAFPSTSCPAAQQETPVIHLAPASRYTHHIAVVCNAIRLAAA